jgi:protein transport protein SEC31
MQPPSNRLMSPAQQHAPLPSVPGPYSPSMQSTQLQAPGPYARATPPPGPLRGPGQPVGPPRPYATPPPGQAGPPAPPPGPYAPPSGQAQQIPPGPYAPPPGQVQQQQPRGIPQGPPRVAPAPHPLAGLPPQQGPPGVASAGGVSNMQPPRSRQGPPPPKYRTSSR